MNRRTAEKLAQAARLTAASGADVWITFVRETAEGGDPVLPLLLEHGLVWQSALLVSAAGPKVAVVGNYDADPLRASGDWDEVVPYVEGIRAPLLSALERLAPDTSRPVRLAVNWSLDDPKADGLTHGMYLQLRGLLEGSRFEGSLQSAERIVSELRSRKTPREVEWIREAVRATHEIFTEIAGYVAIGRTEREMYDFAQACVRRRGLGFSWDPAGDPIVNTGPDSMVGHGLPSETIRVAPGHIVHFDLGVLREGYASDLQRCWFVPEVGRVAAREVPSDAGLGPAAGRGVPSDSALGPAPARREEPALPDDVARAFRAVHGAITAGARALRPGVPGWEVDRAARDFLTGAGFPEYLHALGHQVGRMAHDGGGLLAPRWERYGRMSELPVLPDQVYTLELGVMVDGRGYLGLEEMVRVTGDGCVWLSERQNDMPIVGVAGKQPGGRREESR